MGAAPAFCGRRRRPVATRRPCAKGSRSLAIGPSARHPPVTSLPRRDARVLPPGNIARDGRNAHAAGSQTAATVPPSGGNSNVSSPPCARSEEHTSELQSLAYLVCRLLLEKK